MESYQVMKELGSGSFGKVFKARRRGQASVYVAIKQIKMTALSQKQKDSALNEIRLLASISCPNVISYHTAFFDTQTSNLCIVMEYADGGDLTGLIQKKKENDKKFNQNFIWRVAYDLLRALKVLHSNKILHRDIKPGNVFFVEGVGKLGDLNISKVMEGNFASTQAGTPFYTSPQIWNGRLYDAKCDIWSLGCLLYEIATLRPPFIANSFPLLSKKVNEGYFDPIPVNYSKRLSDVIKSCLKVNMYERPSAAELLKDKVFQFMTTNEEGSVNLLNTIRCPKILSLIQQKLPDFKSADKNTKIEMKKDSLLYKPKLQIKNLMFIDKHKQSSDIRQSSKQNGSERQMGMKKEMKQVHRPSKEMVMNRLQSPQPYRYKAQQPYPYRAQSPVTIYRRIV